MFHPFNDSTVHILLEISYLPVSKTNILFSITKFWDKWHMSGHYQDGCGKLTEYQDLTLSLRLWICEWNILLSDLQLSGYMESKTEIHLFCFGLSLQRYDCFSDTLIVHACLPHMPTLTIPEALIIGHTVVPLGYCFHIQDSRTCENDIHRNTL